MGLGPSRWDSVFLVWTVTQGSDKARKTRRVSPWASIGLSLRDGRAIIDPVGVSKCDRSKDKPFPEGGGRPQEFQNLAADVFQGANSVP